MDIRAYLEKCRLSRLSPAEREAEARKRLASQQLRLKACTEKSFEKLIKCHGPNFCIALGRYTASKLQGPSDAKRSGGGEQEG